VTFIDTLRAARDSAVAVLQEFKVAYPQYPDAVHVFYEGQSDRSFYAGYLAKRVTRLSSIRTYDCKGKPQLLKLFSAIKDQYGEPDRLLFFLDKDLDDLLSIETPGDNRVFVTDTYSIENYLVCEDILQRWIDETFRFNGVAFDMSVVLSQFRLQLQRFHRLCTPIMAWALSHRTAGTRPNLSNVQCSQLFYFANGGDVERQSGALAILDKQAGVVTSAAMIFDIRRNTRQLLNREPKTFVRGKFELWFLIAFIRHIEGVFKALATESYGSVRITTPLHEGNGIELLAPRLPEPPRLSDFLTSHAAVLAAAA